MIAAGGLGFMVWVEPVSYTHLDVYKRQVLMDEYARDRLLADDYFLDLRTLDASFHALPGLNAGGTVLDLSDTPFVRQAGFSGKVYLGVVQNAPHPERAAAYIHYQMCIRDRCHTLP